MQGRGGQAEAGREKGRDKRLRTRSGKTPSRGTEAGKVWETENPTISEM